MKTKEFEEREQGYITCLHCAHMHHLQNEISTYLYNKKRLSRQVFCWGFVTTNSNKV